MQVLPQAGLRDRLMAALSVPAAVPSSDYDLDALVPDGAALRPAGVLVAFDARLNRLGYGGGYYDRTLAGLRAAIAAADSLEVSISSSRRAPRMPLRAARTLTLWRLASPMTPAAPGCCARRCCRSAPTGRGT